MIICVAAGLIWRSLHPDNIALYMLYENLVIVSDKVDLILVVTDLVNYVVMSLFIVGIDFLISLYYLLELYSCFLSEAHDVHRTHY